MQQSTDSTKPEPRMPLTDDELSVLWHQAQQQPFRFARLIEQAHNIKSRR